MYVCMLQCFYTYIIMQLLLCLRNYKLELFVITYYANVIQAYVLITITFLVHTVYTGKN